MLRKNGSVNGSSQGFILSSGRLLRPFPKTGGALKGKQIQDILQITNSFLTRLTSKLPMR